jgi:hypothetical protein
LAALLSAGGCLPQRDRGTDTYITGLRVMAVKAEPPEVAAGQTSTLSMLVVDTMGRPIDIRWAYCELAPPDGQRFNTDCVTTSTGSYLTALTGGPTTTMVMPTVDPTILGSADGSGGVYLPVIATITAGTDVVTAVYHLRVNMGGAANQNPEMTGLYTVMAGAGPPDGSSPGDAGCTADGGMTGSACANGSDLLSWIDPVTPLPVHTGDKLRLRALFTAASAEPYTTPGRVTDAGVGPPRMRTESQDVSFFSTGGTIGGVMGGGMMGFGGGSDATLTIDTNLPLPSGTIDLWAVGRDPRGGTDYLHRTLILQ